MTIFECLIIDLKSDKEPFIVVACLLVKEDERLSEKRKIFK